MEINLGTVLFTMLNLLIIYLFLKHFLFVPVTNFMNKRTASIENDIKDAKAKNEAAGKLKSEYELKITSSEKEGKQIVEEYKAKAINLSDEIMSEAKKEADLIRERAKVDAEREMEKARDEIRHQVIALSLLAASKSIGEQLDSEKHHKLIAEFINKDLGDKELVRKAGV